MAGKEVAAQETVTLGDLPKRGQALMEHLGIKLADPEEIQWRIAERLAYAGTAEELFDAGGALGLREHLEEKFYVRNVDFLPSSQPGTVLFAVIDAVTPTGEPRVFTTGALSVVIQLARGMSEGWFADRPVYANWSTEQATADGNRPYKLFRA